MDHFERLVQQMHHNDDEALVCQGQSYTFRQLDQHRHQWLSQLKMNGVKPGAIVGLIADFSVHSIALLLALLSNRNIVALISAKTSEAEIYLSDTQAEFALRLDDNGYWELREMEGTVTHPLLTALRRSDSAGFVVFSSGSTGRPKAVLHDLNRFLTKFTSARKKLRTITFLLFDHIAGIDTLFYCLSSASTQIVPQNRDVKTICELIQTYRVEVLPTSPTFLNLLWLSGEYRHYDLSSLKIVAYGAERMNQNLLARLNAVLPDRVFIQKYGTSELGSPKSRSRGNDELWINIKRSDCEMKVVDNVLWLRSPAAMLGYLNAPTPFDADGWLSTGDEVIVEGEWIQILGRTSEVINIGGEKVYPADVESVLGLMDGVEEVVVSGEPNLLTGQIVKALVKLNTGETLEEFRKRMQLFCRPKLPDYKIPQKVVFASNELHGERFKKVRKPVEF